jgi:hypothetical protein
MLRFFGVDTRYLGPSCTWVWAKSYGRCWLWSYDLISFLINMCICSTEVYYFFYFYKPKDQDGPKVIHDITVLVFYSGLKWHEPNFRKSICWNFIGFTLNDTPIMRIFTLLQVTTRALFWLHQSFLWYCSLQISLWNSVSVPFLICLYPCCCLMPFF